MDRIGTQRKYGCSVDDFPICVKIKAIGMDVFRGVLSDAEGLRWLAMRMRISRT